MTKDQIKKILTKNGYTVDEVALGSLPEKYIVLDDAAQIQIVVSRGDWSWNYNSYSEAYKCLKHNFIVDTTPANIWIVNH